MLLVEDEADLRLVTSAYLRSRGYWVLEASDVASARERLAAGPVAVVVLDLGLPGEDGLALVAELRSGDTPVIVVTGRGRESDRVAGLEFGADDYLVKPFSQRELAARVAAILRRQRRSETTPVLAFGRLAINTDAREAHVLGDPVALTRLEYDLLVFLASNPGRSYSHEQLLSAVWGSSAAWQSQRTVSEHVYRLRQKLQLAEGRPRIATVRGIGYRFDP